MTLVWRNEIVNICAKPFFLFLLDIRRKTNSHVKHERDGPYSSRTPLSWIGQPGSWTSNSKRLGPDVHVQPAQPEPQCQPGADVSPHGQSGYDHDFLIYPTFPPLTTDSTTTWTIFYPILTSRPPLSGQKWTLYKCTTYLPFVTWPTGYFPLTPTPLFLST